MTNLWPQDMFDNIEDVATPAVILAQQATFLEKASKNVLKGLVQEDEPPQGSQMKFKYDFYINAPTAGNYTYKLLTILHNIYLYPILIYPADDILKEILGNKYSVTTNYLKCDDEENFRLILRQIFNTDKTRKILRSLIQLARGKHSPSPPE
jgi:hypothetical protein